MIALLPGVSIEELRRARLHEELTTPQLAERYGIRPRQMESILRKLGIRPTKEQRRRSYQANARKGGARCHRKRVKVLPQDIPPPPPPQIGAGKDIIALTQEALAKGWPITKCETVYAWKVTGAHLSANGGAVSRDSTQE